jgi:hypothetical protein
MGTGTDWRTDPYEESFPAIHALEPESIGRKAVSTVSFKGT